MAVYRSDQAQLTFATEAAQGGDPEMMVGTLASGPSACTLSGAHAAGSRTLTLNAEFSAWKGNTGATAILAAEALDISEIGVDVDANHDIVAGRVIQVDSESMWVKSVSSNTLTVVRGYAGTTAATHSDDAPIKGSFVPGDIIRIGTAAGTVSATNVNLEVRRVEAVSGASIILDRPLGFYHLTGQQVLPVSAVGDLSGSYGNDRGKYISWIPGVYETVETPDPEMSFEGRRFLGTQSKRNWAYAYPGQQTLAGGISGITLLNGWPLRFPIGTVSSYPSNYTTHSSSGNPSVDAIAYKGDQNIQISSGHGLVAGDIITIYGSSAKSIVKSEIRRIEYFTDVSGSNVNARLNYPLTHDHAVGHLVREAVGGAATAADYYSHDITEENDLDSVSWHVHMLPSDEDADKAFDRRYVGGKIGSATLSASEGEMVTFSWEGVNFLNMMHNQQNQTTVGSDANQAAGASASSLYVGASIAANMPRYALMHNIDSDDIGMPRQATNTANTGTGYPTTQPYYFSQGVIKYFGTEFARIESFSLTIENGMEPRYYIGRQGSRSRGPFEILEGQRAYNMSATLTLPDASLDADTAHGSAVLTNATELFKQLLLEGDYSGSTGRLGFTSTIKFERGTNDYIIIDIPASAAGAAGTPATPTGRGVNEQGIFIQTAPHAITADNPFAIDVSMMFRELKISIRDDEPYYP